MEAEIENIVQSKQRKTFKQLFLITCLEKKDAKQKTEERGEDEMAKSVEKNRKRKTITRESLFFHGMSFQRL